jgi:predicted alpha/beta hydrolase family esterase
LGTRVLMVPGLNDSGPQHWQTLWQTQLPECSRIEQRDFVNAVCSEWISNIEAAVSTHGADSILVGHSCGSIAIVHWAAQTQLKIAGAMLIAPSDAEREGFPVEAVGFSPVPMRRLPFPTLVIAGNNDPYLRLERAELFATAWGSQLVNIGAAGHINTDSGYGPWPEGLRMLREFVATRRTSVSSER